MLQKTDICFWIFRDHWNFDLLFRLTRAKLCYRYEMVSFFIQVDSLLFDTHCRKIRANMSACWAMSVQLQDIVTRRRRICLTMAYCCLIKCRSFVCYEIVFLSRPFSLCSPCGSAISLKFRIFSIKTFLWVLKIHKS